MFFAVLRSCRDEQRRQCNATLSECKNTILSCDEPNIPSLDKSLHHAHQHSLMRGTCAVSAFEMINSNQFDIFLLHRLTTAGAYSGVTSRTRI